MTTYGAVDIVGLRWGFDTAILGALSDAQLLALFQTPLPASITGPGDPQFAEFAWGYCPFYGAKASAWDLTGPRMRAIADVVNGAGRYAKALLVQHCRTSTTMNAVQGDQDGKTAADYATAQGYPATAHLAQDDEAVRNPGPDGIASVTAWAQACLDGGPTGSFAPCTYEGYSPGDGGAGVSIVSCYWGAVGNWAKAARGVRCKQHLQITHCGIEIDPDFAAPDKLGGVLRGFGRLTNLPVAT